MDNDDCDLLGSRVQLLRLKKRVELNGVYGVVEQQLAKGRLVVKVDLYKKKLLVRPVNLKVLEAKPWQLCPIMRTVMVDPVMAADGHSYDRAHIARWIDKAGPCRSPKTNEMLSNKKLVTKHALRDAICDAGMLDPDTPGVLTLLRHVCEATTRMSRLPPTSDSSVVKKAFLERTSAIKAFTERTSLCGTLFKHLVALDEAIKVLNTNSPLTPQDTTEELINLSCEYDELVILFRNVVGTNPTEVMAAEKLIIPALASRSSFYVDVPSFVMTSSGTLIWRDHMKKYVSPVICTNTADVAEIIRLHSKSGVVAFCELEAPADCPTEADWRNAIHARYSNSIDTIFASIDGEIDVGLTQLISELLHRRSHVGASILPPGMRHARNDIAENIIDRLSASACSASGNLNVLARVRHNGLGEYEYTPGKVMHLHDCNCSECCPQRGETVPIFKESHEVKPGHFYILIRPLLNSPK